MRFFDWLLGASRVGVVKTSLLGLLLGFLAVGITVSVTDVIYTPESSHRFFLLAVGFPVLWVVRAIYWSWRRVRIWEGLRRDDDRAWHAAYSLFQNRPSLVREFAPTLHEDAVAHGLQSSYGPDSPHR